MSGGIVKVKTVTINNVIIAVILNDFGKNDDFIYKLEKCDRSLKIGLGDEVWWQKDKLYWTPSKYNTKAGKYYGDRDVPINRV